MQTLSITSAARQFNLPRDTVLDAVRDGRLTAVRDRRGILRIKVDAVLGFCGPANPVAEMQHDGNVVRLGVMRADRLAQVIAQQTRLLQEFRPE
jgi:excisionase family DNA binding protein